MDDWWGPHFGPGHPVVSGRAAVCDSSPFDVVMWWGPDSNMATVVPLLLFSEVLLAWRPET